MKFPQKVPVEQRINKQTNRVMLIKALNNAGVGFPISALLNIIITLPFSIFFIAAGWPAWIYPFLLGVPFVVVSVTRQFLIDYYMAVYNINCDPSYLIRKGFILLMNRLHNVKKV